MTTTALPTRLHAIEALRGWAALYVVAFHLLEVPTTPVPPPPYAKSFLEVGNSGVTLFFLISAFTLCLSSDSRNAAEPRPLLRFYLRRVFRIVPLFLVLLVITITRAWIRYDVGPNPWAVGANLAFLYNFIPGKQAGIVWASWTLGVEMVFYFFFPFIFRIVNSLTKALGFFAVSVVGAFLFGALVNYRTDFFPLGLFRHLPAFACGMVMFFLFKNHQSWLSPSRAFVLIIIGCCGRWALSGYGFTDDYGQLIALESLVWGALALGLCRLPLLAFVNPATRFSGEISYSIYLLHPLILFELSPLFAMLAPSTGSWHYETCLIASLAIIITMAVGTYYAIERPGMRLGSRLIRNIASSNPVLLEPVFPWPTNKGGGE